MAKMVGKPHVIQLYEVWHDVSNVHTVMEYLQEDVIGLLNRVGVLADDSVKRVFAHMSIGLKQLHDAGFCHRDFSPENVLVSTDALSLPLAKVIDFGMVSPLGALSPDGSERDLPGMPVPFGKMSYLSPEYFARLPYGGRKNDLWALGCTLFTLSERKMLFEQPSVADPRFLLLHQGRHGELFDLSRKTDHAWQRLPEADWRPRMGDGLRDLLCGLLQVRPEHRVASVDAVLAHPWLVEAVAGASREWAASQERVGAPAAAPHAAAAAGGGAAEASAEGDSSSSSSSAFAAHKGAPP